LFGASLGVMLTVMLAHTAADAGTMSTPFGDFTCIPVTVQPGETPNG